MLNGGHRLILSNAGRRGKRNKPKIRRKTKIYFKIVVNIEKNDLIF